jgi:aminoglycoside phosphotransferase (APT) family kinase protein
VNVAAGNLEFAQSMAKVSELKKLGEGRQAELFIWSGDVVKLLRDARDLELARLEATDMRALQATEVPMPHFLGTVTIEGRPGIIMERLIGVDQLSRLGRKPWMIWRFASTLGRLHAQLHVKNAPEDLRSLRESLRAEIEGSASVPSDCKQRALAALDHLPDGDAICHWDFHPGNVIETAHGPKIIDWAVVRRGHALADVARTLLIIEGGALPPGAPFIVRTLTALGRFVLARRYLRVYRKLRPFKKKRVAAMESRECDIAVDLRNRV